MVIEPSRASEPGIKNAGFMSGIAARPRVAGRTVIRHRDRIGSGHRRGELGAAPDRAMDNDADAMKAARRTSNAMTFRAWWTQTSARLHGGCGRGLVTASLTGTAHARLARHLSASVHPGGVPIVAELAEQEARDGRRRLRTVLDAERNRPRKRLVGLCILADVDSIWQVGGTLRAEPFVRNIVVPAWPETRESRHHHGPAKAGGSVCPQTTLSAATAARATASERSVSQPAFEALHPAAVAASRYFAAPGSPRPDESGLPSSASLAPATARSDVSFPPAAERSPTADSSRASATTATPPASARG